MNNNDLDILYRFAGYIVNTTIRSEMIDLVGKLTDEQRGWFLINLSIEVKDDLTFNATSEQIANALIKTLKKE